MDPYTQLGYARLQWGEQQLKASKAYLQKMTSGEKNLMQITFIPDLDSAFTVLNKCAASLQIEKWEAKKQLADATRILTALVAVRRHFMLRVAKISNDLELQQKSQKGAPILCLGDVVPPWMQRISKDALTEYPWV